MYEYDKSKAAVQVAIRAAVDKEIRPLRLGLELLMILPGSNEIQTTQIARDLLRQGAPTVASA